MPVNTLQYSTIFQSELDKQMEHVLLTNWMDNNSGQVIYNGGNEVKIPKMSLVGLGDYDRDEGYKKGSVTLSYETLKMTQDRGRKFTLDAMDVDETNFVATAGNVMGEFQRVYVAPEVDAYRISKAIDDVKGKLPENIMEVALTKENILEQIEVAADKIRDQGYQGEIICHITYETLRLLKLALANTALKSDTLKLGEVSIDVYKLDEITFIPTPKNRMYTAITLSDGSTTSTGGYTKGSTAKDVNFFMAPINAVIGVTKQDKTRVFDPDTNQEANAWSIDYRRYHDCWIKDNALPLIVANVAGE